MRRYILPALVGLMTLIAGGCSRDYYARQLIHPSTAYGKAKIAILPSGEKLVASGRIDAHRRIAMDDGTVIDTWVLASKTTPPLGTVLILHGIIDSKARYLPLAERLAKMGYDAVLIDHRAHGRSSGQYITWGALEHRDAVAVIDALTAESVVTEPLYAFGVSMGASIAVQYAAADSRCRGVMAVAPFEDLREITNNHFKVLSEPMREEILIRAGVIGRFDPAEASAVAAASRLTCPLLVVHGRIDAVVPYKQGLAVFSAAPEPKKLITLAPAGHATIMLGREKWFAQKLDALATKKLQE